MELRARVNMMRCSHRLLCSLFLAAALFGVAAAATRRHDWDISYQFTSPDCVRKLAVTINGHTPGPTIRAVQGDTIVVNVKNSLLTENVAIHWHGIRQIGTPWADGTEGVTQCPILPGDTFAYTFVVDRPGTYMYHAHYGMQRSAGLNGMIVVEVAPGAAGDGEREPFRYDGEHTVLLNDWWHRSTYEQAAGLASVPMVWVGEPQSLLINGRGRFVNCSSSPATAASCNVTHPDCAPAVFAVVPGKTYRFRIASVTSLSALNFEIEGHEMTVVEADGHYVKPFVVKNLNIYSGETYSVLITADQDPNRNYWLASNVVSRKPATPTGTAWALNNVSFTLPHTPYLVAMKRGLLGAFDQRPPPETYAGAAAFDVYAVQGNPNATTSDAPYRLRFGSVVDRDAPVAPPRPRLLGARLRRRPVRPGVLQNANMLAANSSETHPWHLHGHDFWVLGHGAGRFDPAVHPAAAYNLRDPIMKNTVAVHPFGWTAIRFRADNPGVWAFHCHIEAHFFMGMGIVFEEGVDRVGDLPPEIMGCGKTRGGH
uniref:L-ascorbate oxidase n=1 Tax=Oryza barthii TaxID=65489 RepID=A0A0D3H618_9ORYZ